MRFPARFLSSLNNALAVGIDVSKAKLDVCVLLSSDDKLSLTINNNASDTHALAKVLSSHGYKGKIIMESTGHYHWRIALELSAAGLDVRLLNPLLSSKHSKSAVRKTKTDAVDAYHLAMMALTERSLPPRWSRSRKWVSLRHAIGALRSVEKSLQQLRGTLRSHQEAMESIGIRDSSLVSALTEQLERFERLRIELEKSLVRELQSYSDGSRQSLFASIPGVSAFGAGLMDLLLSDDVSSSKSWIAFVGLDVSVRSSGQWRGRCSLTRRGNAYFRKRLYQMAWGAMQTDPGFKAYYDDLRGMGRGYVESLVIISRKILRIAYSLSKHNKFYDSSMLVKA
jgi:transposase